MKSIRPVIAYDSLQINRRAHKTAMCTRTNDLGGLICWCHLRVSAHTGLVNRPTNGQAVRPVGHVTG